MTGSNRSIFLLIHAAKKLGKNNRAIIADNNFSNTMLFKRKNS